MNFEVRRYVQCSHHSYRFQSKADKTFKSRDHAMRLQIYKIQNKTTRLVARIETAAKEHIYSLTRRLLVLSMISWQSFNHWFMPKTRPCCEARAP